MKSEPAGDEIRAVLLDAGGVFLLPDAIRVRAALDRLGLPTDDSLIFAAHYHGMRALDRSPGPDVYWPAYVHALGIASDRTAAALGELATLPWTSVVSESVSALRALASRGVPLAIVSNAGGTVERELLERRICQVGEGPGACVAAVVDSTVVGFEKPDPRIFQHALERIGADAATAVHVGDSVYLDVEGARAAGIRPFHFDPPGVCDDRSHSHLASLHDLLPLLA